ncbi:uncharacterized protein DNG_07115 [Cephalotrichum gorgonifer]|uniref:Uncharacterized protein n=1 Tax=Cephalotrichum gorgonifer TaxID=2041049 RepID=A0AAE8N122_9PEZI|nr:uncharacterized protein DNG_07115 [Cephalotrichum gorgonifer]
MAKTEQNACLSTSYPQAPTPPSSPEREVETQTQTDTESESGGGIGPEEKELAPPAVPPKPASSQPLQPRPKQPDYILVLCYILVYIEVGWLIFMVLRPNSRD